MMVVCGYLVVSKHHLMAIDVNEYRDFDYYLYQGAYGFGSIGLFVCLPVSKITQIVMNGLL